MKKLLIFIFLLISVRILFANDCVALHNGNWTSASTWSSGRVPGCGDIVTIPAGITVTVDVQVNLSGCATPVGILVFGTMKFQTGNKIRLSCNSAIDVRPGGQIIPGGGGGSSNLIEICNVVLWTSSDGTVNGPKVFGSPLPVNLLSLTAKCNGKTNITWSTLTETNNDYFTLYKSSDAENWDYLATIDGHGNSNEILNYQYIDNNASYGITYYRLKQTDFDGKSEAFNPVAVICSSSGAADFKIFPNPFKGALTLQYTNLSQGNGQVKVYNMMGNMVLNRDIEISEGSNDYLLDLDNLSAGFYNVEFIAGETNYHEKVVKN